MHGDPEKDLFICHSSIDKDWVKTLGERVEAEQWNGRNLSVFIDAWDIQVGENIILKINDALERSRFLAVVLSPEMIGSEWCRAEYAAVLAQDPTNRRGRILPIRYRDFHQVTRERLTPPPLLGGLAYLDFRQQGAFEGELQRILARLRGEPPPRGRLRRASESRSPADTLVPAIPERRDEPDPQPEQLLSNLLPVTSLPKIVWSAPTSLRTKKELPAGENLPPFILRDERLYSFFDLSRPDTPFAAHIAATGTNRHSAVEWQADAARWRWYIELLNLCLRDHLRPEVHFDKLHGRFWFVPQGTESVKLKWGAGTQKTVVKAPEPDSAQNWVHHAARLQFETIDTSVFLSVDPTYVFTVDGWKPVPEEAVRPLAMMWGGRERNGAILRNVLLWADVVTKGQKVRAIAVGDQVLEISRLPTTVEAPIGLATDRVQVRALLEFSHEEWSLNTPFGFVHADEAQPQAFNEIEDDF